MVGTMEARFSGCAVGSKFFFASFWCINEFGAHFPL